MKACHHCGGIRFAKSATDETREACVECGTFRAECAPDHFGGGALCVICEEKPATETDLTFAHDGAGGGVCGDCKRELLDADDFLIGRCGLGGWSPVARGNISRL